VRAAASPGDVFINDASDAARDLDPATAAAGWGRQRRARGKMSKRRVVWKASDIRDWDMPPAKSKPPSAPPALDPEVMVQVRTGKQEWSTRLRWVMDLLDRRESAALQSSLAAGRPLVLASRTGRAAMTIAAANPGGQGPAAASSASDPAPEDS